MIVLFIATTIIGGSRLMIIIRCNSPFVNSVPPAVWIPNQTVGAPLGYEVTLNCHIEAYPASVNYWLRESTGEIIESNDKYAVLEETKDYKTHLMLTIRSLDKEDLGGFTCFAKNLLGTQEGTVKLHGKFLFLLTILIRV